MLYSGMPNGAWIEHLEQLLIDRRVSEAFSLYSAQEATIENLQADNPTFISLVLCAAQLSDLGYRDLAWFEFLVSKLPAASVDMPFIEFVRLNLIEGYRMFAKEEQNVAIEILERILRFQADLPLHLLFISHFWKGRAHRQKGEYQTAREHISKAQAIAEKADAPRLIAITKIHESWLVFQVGERQRAFELLDQAERELKPVGHALSLGNIESARGRFIRRTGDYQTALAHFNRAIELYSGAYSQHPNLARALVNAAYVKRLMALDLKPMLQKRPVRRVSNEAYLQLTRDALALLERAGELYSRTQHQSGLGSSLVNAGHLHLESGDIEQAAAKAEYAYRLAHDRNDQILLARTRNLQSALERAIAEEGIEDAVASTLHAKRAIQYAEEAIECANHTQNKRLLAESYIARGLAAMGDVTRDTVTAKENATKAAALLDPSDCDHLVKELATLKGMIFRSTRVDDALRRWASGDLGEKTFLQIQEEFAQFVIPRIWSNLGCNTAEVARRLSISPKKVRRILRAAGLGG